MTLSADFTIRSDDQNRNVLSLSGYLEIATVDNLPQQFDALDHHIDLIDLADVQHIDTVGAWLVYRLGRDQQADIINGSSDATRLIKAVGDSDRQGAVRPDAVFGPTRILNEIGGAVSVFFFNFLGIIGFLGEIVSALARILTLRSRFRWRATIRHFEQVGVSSLGIVGLMSFLIGIVIAQQGAVQLRQFGAEIFTVNLVGRLSLRELGVLMTAIMIAGRSGSAFAAQIGTMQMTEEVDAMRTIGVSPIEALVLPRVAAAVFMMPLLGFYAALMSMLGGALLCWITLEIPPATFIRLIQEAVPMYDLYVCIAKAPIFGLIIALSGCYQGMQVRGNAEEVGLRTTAAVVQAIFMVIVLDAFFAVFFTEIGWG